MTLLVPSRASAFLRLQDRSVRLHSIRSLGLFLRPGTEFDPATRTVRVFSISASPGRINGLVRVMGRLHGRRDHLFSARRINKSPRYEIVSRRLILTVIRKIRITRRRNGDEGVRVSAREIGRWSSGKLEGLHSKFHQQCRFRRPSSKLLLPVGKVTPEKNIDESAIGSETHLALEALAVSADDDTRIDSHKLRKSSDAIKTPYLRLCYHFRAACSDRRMAE